MNYRNFGVGPEPRKRSAPPPPFGGSKKAPAVDVMLAVGVPKRKPAAPTAEHEAMETPEYEAREEAGAGLLEKIDAICDRGTAAALFGALADALRGEVEPDMGDQMESGEME